MKNVIFAALTILFVSACLPETSQNETSSAAVADIATLKISNSRSLYNDRFSKRIYSLLTEGELSTLHYIDQNGDEQELRLEPTFFNRLNDHYLIIELNNQYQALVNLQSGSFLRLDDYNLSAQSITYFNGALFAFNKDLKSLIRLDIATKTASTYATLPDNLTFMLGLRLSVSDTTIWWDDDNIPFENSKNFRTILIDRNFNVLAQVSDSITSTFPYVVVEPSGQISQINANYADSKLITLTYSNDSSLYILRTISGHYINSTPSSPAASAADITLSELTFSSTGLHFQDVQQIFPYSSLTNDSRPYRCRSNYTIDTAEKYIVAPETVFKLDDTGATTTITSHALAAGDTAFLLNTFDKPSNYCFISGHWIFYRSVDKNSILRRDLSDTTHFSPETVASRSNINSFFIMGDRLYYSTDQRSYQLKIDGSGESESENQSTAHAEDAADLN